MDGVVIILVMFLLGSALKKGGAPGVGTPTIPEIPKPRPMTPQIPIPVPPRPAFVPRPAQPKQGAAQIPGGKAIAISADCKTASLLPNWQATISPTVEAAIAAGRGLPLFTPATAARSVDAVIRQVVKSHGGGLCIDSAPWIDVYAQNHPPPAPQSGESAADWRVRARAWDQSWDAIMKNWAGAHPQAYNVFSQLGQYIVQRWLGESGIVPATGPGAAGSGQPKSIPAAQTANDSAALRLLGYTPSPIATEEFQADYNLLQNFRTNFGWTTMGLDLEVDNLLGTQTRAALADAIQLSGGNPARWSVLVGTAREGG